MKAGHDISSPKEIFNILGEEIPDSFAKVEKYIFEKIEEEKAEDSDYSTESDGSVHPENEASSETSNSSLENDLDLLTV